MLLGIQQKGLKRINRELDVRRDAEKSTRKQLKLTPLEFPCGSAGYGPGIVTAQVTAVVQVQSLAQGSSHSGSVETNLTSMHEDIGWIPGLAQCVKVPVLPDAGA